MQQTFQVVFIVLGNVALVSFLGGFVSGLRLSPYDAELQRSRREAPGFRWWPKQWPAPKKEDYPEDLQSLWVFRDRCFKTFAVCIGMLAITAVAEVAAGLDLPVK